MLGERYSQRNENLFDYVDKWLPLADQCFERGVFCAPMDPYILFHTAAYLVWRSRLVPDHKGNVFEKETTGVYLKAEGIRKFQEYFQRFLELKPGSWKKAMETVWAFYPDDGIVLGIVPRKDEETKHRVLMELAKKG